MGPPIGDGEAFLEERGSGGYPALRAGNSQLMVDTDKNTGALAKKDGALTGAVVSAAVGMAVYALRKALSEGGRALPPREHEERDEDERDENDRSMLATAWESASDAALPLAEEAAEAAGRWAATKAPAVIRERILPRFIDSFEAAG
jgi:hypothetical protein